MTKVTKELKMSIIDQAKPILKKYNLKGSFSLINGDEIRLTIREGPFEFDKLLRGRSHIVLCEDLAKLWLEGCERKAILALFKALKSGHIEQRSKPPSDGVWYYYSLQIGTHVKAYNEIFAQ